MIFKNKYILFGVILLFISSCTINSNRMLRTPRNYEFDKLESKLNELEYKIDVNDQLTFQLFTNNGFQLVDMFAPSVNSQNQTQRILQNGGIGNNLNSGSLYLVRIDSLIEFPIIGDINLVGKTIKEAENFLEKKFSEFYVDPFIVLGVITKRILLFNGSSGGEASVLPLTYNNMTLFEVLASAGGILKVIVQKELKLLEKLKME